MRLRNVEAMVVTFMFSHTDIKGLRIGSPRMGRMTRIEPLETPKFSGDRVYLCLVVLDRR